MKKLSLLTAFILCFLLSGCIIHDPRYINFSKKPSNNYYTNELIKEFNANTDYSIYIFDTNLYKNLKVDSATQNIVSKFTVSLKSDNFLSQVQNEQKESYRLKIVFPDQKVYLIKIFNNENVTIAPWDGIYSEDFVNMKNIPLEYNLYDFCNHVHCIPYK